MWVAGLEGGMSKPKRIQLSRRKGWRMPPNTVKVDRSTKWGNPFKVGRPYLDYATGKVVRPATTAACVLSFSNWINTMPGMRDKISAQLRGKNLACWCKPGDPCHADVLLEIANS